VLRRERPGWRVTTPRPPAAYLHGLDGSVRVPGRIAAWLVRRAGLSDLRLSMRGVDPELDAVMEAIVMTAAAWRLQRGATSDLGSEQGKHPDVSSGSTLTTTEAADLLGVSSRAIRLAIADSRLDARASGGVWLIDREDLERFRAARAIAGNGGPE
jgi:excisionase family DNA binding protein